MKGQVLDAKMYERHISLMTKVEAASLVTSQSVSDYWWNLWCIYSEETWKAVTEDGKFSTFLGDFTRSPFGSSTQTFYNRIKAIKKWLLLGMNENQIRLLLGSRSEMALQMDIEDWFQKNGELKPDVVKQIEDGHETPIDYLERVSQLSPTEARQEVQRLTIKDKIFALSDTTVYDERTGALLFNVRWDNEEDGLMWLGTIRITGVQLAPEETGQMFLPEKVADYLMKRLGLGK